MVSMPRAPQRLLAMLMMWACAIGAWAADASIELQTNRMAAGEAIIFQVTVVGGEPRGVPRVTTPSALRVAYVGQSQTMSIVRGRAQRYVQFRYELVAAEAGPHTLGPATLEVREGNQIVSVTAAAIHIDVAAQRSTGNLSVPIEVQVGFEPAEAWQGQVVLLTTRSRSRADVLGSAWSALPEEHLLAPRDGSPTRAEYVVRDAAGDVNVDETAWPRIAAEPGEHRWPAPVLQLEIASGRGRRDMFGMLMRRTERVMVPAEPVTLTVRPRPSPPADFSGLVGDFQLVERLATETATVGQSVDWSFELRGDGTVESFILPPAPDIEGARVYDATPQARATMQRGRYDAAIAWRRTFVPTREGKVQIPAVRFSTFSPTQGAYVVHEVPARMLRVRPGEADAVGLTSFGSADAVTEAAPEAPSAPRASGPSLRVPWERLLGPGLVFTGLPGLGAGAAAGLSWLRARRTRAIAPRDASPDDLLATLHEPGADRAAVLDAALRLALHRAPSPRPDDPLHDGLLQLSTLLDQARFAGRPLPDNAEARVRAAVRALESR